MRYTQYVYFSNNQQTIIIYTTSITLLPRKAFFLINKLFSYFRITDHPFTHIVFLHDKSVSIFTTTKINQHSIHYAFYANRFRTKSLPIHHHLRHNLFQVRTTLTKRITLRNFLAHLRQHLAGLLHLMRIMIYQLHLPYMLLHLKHNTFKRKQ